MEVQKDPLNELMMAQQPIFDRNKKLYGYELLFRGDHEHSAKFDNPEVATSQVIVNLCIGITEMETQLRQPFFINMTTELVLSDAFFPISPDTVYIEILEEQNITPEFVDAVQRWHQLGFRFVLDDYQFSPTYEPLLPYMSMIKIDVLATPPDTVLPELEELKRRKLSLVAEKVENEEMFQRCAELGFHYFQGYHLQRPEIVKGKKVKAGMQSAVRLVNQLQDDNVSIDAVAQLVGQNPTLSYQMLRLLNSPVVGLSTKVESIKAAVVLLGLTQIKRWSMLITLSSHQSENHELLRLLLVRARCCELLAKKSKNVSPDMAFTVGLMSGMDRVLQMSKRELLDQITLNDEAKVAILEYKGPLGKLLFVATSIEEARWDKIRQMPVKVRSSLNQVFFESLQWSRDVMDAMK